MIHVDVKGTDKASLQKALTEFNKQVKKSGLLTELRNREHYEKPSRARKLKSERAAGQRVRDAKKANRKKS